MAYVKRLIYCCFGLFLFGFGLYLNILANIGLTPWSSFAMGISLTTGIKYGNASIIIGLVIIALDLLFREQIGIGSVLNAVLVGKTVDFFLWLDIFPQTDNFYAGTAVLLAGQFLVALGSFIYMSVELGCGPRDALMVALGKRLKKLPIGVVRGSIEFMAALSGWLLGAKIGVGTILSAVAVSFFIQMVFRFFRYDPKSARHENFIDTYKILFNSKESDDE